MKIMKITLTLAIGLAVLACNKNSETESVSGYNGLVINEIAAHDESGVASWVEIANGSSSSISLDGIGLYLFDTYFDGKQIWTGSGSLAAGERLVVSTEDDLVTGIESSADFTLVLGKSKKKAIDSWSNTSLGSLTEAGSYQRLPDMTGEFRVLTYPSKGKENKIFDVSDTKPNAVWMWSKYMDEWLEDDAAVLKEIKALGYDHVLLNFSGFENRPKIAKQFIAKAEELGVTVHAWTQCFYKDGSWINPVDDDNNCYKQEIFDDILAHCKKYIEEFGVKGLHLDYIRFGGTAYKHCPSSEITGTGAVTEFCRQLREFVDTYDENIVLSAAMMAEDNASYYYGQNHYQMGRYIDIFMPMIYRYQANNLSYTDSWCIKWTKYFLNNNNGRATCWSGLTTYNYPSGNTVVGLDSETILNDCKVMKEGGATGIVLFRYGYGDFPDVNELWND